MKSPLRPGETALHFAADTSIEAVELLIKRGAKMDVENAIGLTPLDICVNNYSIEDIWNVLLHDNDWKTICMTDGKTSLLEVFRHTAHVVLFKLFMQQPNRIYSVVPSDAAILPGCTVLHLAVLFSQKIEGLQPWENTYDDRIVKYCLKRGLDINTQNSRGQTPIHLAVKLGKENIVTLLLEKLDQADEITNLVDENNLSYLHIACAMDIDQTASLVEKLLRNSSPNIAYNGQSMLMGSIIPGSTPLHLASGNGFDRIADILLENGANLHATDTNGMTPIHWILQLGAEDCIQIGDVLLSSLLENPKDVVVNGIGLSYLHIACYADHIDAVDKLLELGSDTNMPIVYENTSDNRYLNKLLDSIAKFTTHTPLHLSLIPHVTEVIRILLLYSADLFAKVSNNNKGYWSFPLEDRYVTRIFMSMLSYSFYLQRGMERRFGLTKLHIACYLKDEKKIKLALEDGIDVNVQVNADSEIFAGYTPLHMLIAVSHWKYVLNLDDPTFVIESMIRMLLERGADVTITNVKKDTPIHDLFDNKRFFADANGCMSLLINAHQDLSVNPINAEGLSHFHVACSWHEVEVVQRFLQHGTVDVNWSIDYFAVLNGGYTALHFILDHEMAPDDDWTNVLQIVDLLLKNGADVHAQDFDGNTPLHKPAAVRSPELCIVDKLMSYGADMNTKNIKGKSPFEKQMDYLVFNTDYATVSKKYNFTVNSWNSLTDNGYIGKIFSSQIADDEEKLKNIVLSIDAQSIDQMGRTVIHNAVAIPALAYVRLESYNYAFDIFINRGVDIDHQDLSGQTALFHATRAENDDGVIALLSYGADINILDNNEKSVLSCIMEYSKRDFGFGSFPAIADIFYVHVKKLQYLKLELNQVNKDFSEDLPYYGDEVDDVLSKFNIQVEMSKIVDVGVNTLTFFHFLNETGGVTLYPYLSQSEQNNIDNFFKNISQEEFSEMIGIAKLQYRKMKERLGLIDEGFAALRKLLGFSVPGLCEEISRFLTNTDLKNIIACFDDIENDLEAMEI